MKKTVFLIAISLFFNCKESKQIGDKQVKENKNKIEKLLNQGYKVGTFILNKDSNCTYLIKDKENSSLLDPINLDDEKYAEYKNLKEDIYYKYLPLRRMSRCSNTIPIKLIEMKTINE